MLVSQQPPGPPYLPSVSLIFTTPRPVRPPGDTKVLSMYWAAVRPDRVMLFIRNPAVVVGTTFVPASVHCADCTRWSLTISVYSSVNPAVVKLPPQIESGK